MVADEPLDGVSDSACRVQATPCITDATAEVKRCVHRELHPACVEQVAAAQRR